MSRPGGFLGEVEAHVGKASATAVDGAPVDVPHAQQHVGTQVGVPEAPGVEPGPAFPSPLAGSRPAAPGEPAGHEGQAGLSEPFSTFHRVLSGCLANESRAPARGPPRGSPIGLRQRLEDACWGRAPKAPSGPLSWQAAGFSTRASNPFIGVPPVLSDQPLVDRMPADETGPAADRNSSSQLVVADRLFGGADRPGGEDRSVCRR